jgi:YgiT-type zinc finger domain-containing protein
MIKCHICGGSLRPTRVDLPFKRDEKSIVIFKDIPLLQCDNCPEYLIEDPVMRKVEAFLEGVASSSELEIVRYAA